MIDTHAHIDGTAFDEDRQEMLDRAVESGLECIIIPAIEPTYFNSLYEFTSQHQFLYCAAGIHPHNANECDNDNLDKVRDLSSKDKVVAIGEIGLDYYYDFAPKETQKEAFRKQLNIAKERKLPVIIHNREADNDILEILSEEGKGNIDGVLHCFSSPKEMLFRALDLGFYISFTGNITFNKSKLGELVKEVPMDRILLETDSPYMTPVPFRGKRNEPSFVKYIAEKISQFKSIPLEEVIMTTSKNAKKLFLLPIILLMILLSSQNTYSQRLPTVVMEPEEYEYEEEYNPYRKYIGLAPVIGFNTIVYTYYLPEGEKDVSMEGIIAYGASFSVGVTDFLIIEFTYLYSKNEKFARDWLDENGNFTLNPNFHRFYEISTHWITNPSGRIGIYGTLGYSFIHNKYGIEVVEDPGFIINTTPGVNVGLGAYINIPTSWGLIVPTFGWRLDFELGASDASYPISKDGELVVIETEATTFFSIPRVGLIWFLPISW